MNEAAVPLTALSGAQRDLVERHLPLVRHTLKRNRHLIRVGRDARDGAELFQEGCLALIEAVRNHDTARHGHFAAYAMARIHFALSRYVHEREYAVRVPFITQRRRKPTCPDHQADQPPLPTVVRMNEQATQAVRRPTRSGGAMEEPTIGELLGERIDVAMRQVTDQLKQGRRCAPGIREVVERCVRERWSVPEPEARTSIRQLAKDLNCSVGRITHCEERFKKGMATALNDDPQYRTLKRKAAASRHGVHQRMNRSELAPERPADATIRDERERIASSKQIDKSRPK